MAKEVIRMIPNENKEVQERVRYSRKSITPSGYFGASPDNIVEIENFITEEEQEYLLNFAKSNVMWDVTESQWNENGNKMSEEEYKEGKLEGKWIDRYEN